LKIFFVDIFSVSVILKKNIFYDCRCDQEVLVGEWLVDHPFWKPPGAADPMVLAMEVHGILQHIDRADPQDHLLSTGRFRNDHRGGYFSYSFFFKQHDDDDANNTVLVFSDEPG
jgi:hypothetical protein